MPYRISWGKDIVNQLLSLNCQPVNYYQTYVTWESWITQELQNLFCFNYQSDLVIPFVF
ncbi:hypothetical protein V6Z12_D13G045400 [Gossypium hirsutum]